MSHIYRAKPDVVRAMFWDGSKESYLKIKTWMEKNHFLLEDQGPYCQYWEDYDAPPPERDEAAHDRYGLRLSEQEFEWRYRMIKFYAWGDDQEVDYDRWIVFRGSEQDDVNDLPTPHGDIMRDEEFRKKFEPVYGGYGDADGS